MHYEFTAELWVYPGEAAWHFITVPREYSEEIRMVAEQAKRGFGSVRVTAQIGDSSWQTSIFPDSKSGSYILPVKKTVRSQDNLQSGELVHCAISIVQ